MRAFNAVAIRSASPNLDAISNQHRIRVVFIAPCVKILAALAISFLVKRGGHLCSPVNQCTVYAQRQRSETLMQERGATSGRFFQRLFRRPVREELSSAVETPTDSNDISVENEQVEPVFAPDANFLLQLLEKLRWENAALSDRLARSERVISRMITNFSRASASGQPSNQNWDSRLEKEISRLRARLSDLETDFEAFRAAAFVKRKIKPRDVRRVGSFQNSTARCHFESFFDREWYGARYPDVEKAGIDAIVHYFEFGFAEGRFPHPLFDTRWYLKNNSDVRSSGINPFEHFLTTGLAELRQPNFFLDLRWYVENNADVAANKLDPFEHYVRIGCFEARDPGPMFNAKEYFAKHPQIELGRIDALAHSMHAAR